MRHLDLFSGIGGFALGLQWAGSFDTIGFCEVDKVAQKVLKKHWPNVPIYDDVKTLKGSDVGTVDIITGGFPCQDISVAGKGAGLAGERSGLWFEYHRIIKETRPKWVIAENVSALRSRGLDQVLRSLAEIGYDAEWHCIPASAVGAPHRRDRIWIVAYPSGGKRISGTEEQRVLRALSEDRTIDNNAGGRSETHPSTLAHTSGEGLEGQRLRESSTWSEQSKSSGSGCIVRTSTRSSQWDIEPSVGRVANGVSGRTHRLKQLGNAVVPQIVQLIGQAILQKE